MFHHFAGIVGIEWNAVVLVMVQCNRAITTQVNADDLNIGFLILKSSIAIRVN